VPSLDTLENEGAARLHDSAVEAWGEAGWAALGRVCRDAVRRGAPYPANWCPADPDAD